MKLATLALFFSCLLNAHLLYPVRNLHTVTVTFSDELPMVLVDKKQVMCHCGKKPVQIHVLNGIVFANCESHRL